jgi:hypothetical protein
MTLHPSHHARTMPDKPAYRPGLTRYYMVKEL